MTSCTKVYVLVPIFLMMARDAKLWYQLTWLIAGTCIFCIFYYRHVTLITDLCFQFWFLHPIFKSLNSEKTRHPTRIFHHSSCSSIPIDLICVQYTLCIHTQNDIWKPETEILDHKFPFCPSAPHVWCYDVASCTCPHIHWSCLALLDVTSMTLRQWRYVRWALRENLAKFLDVYNPKIVYTGIFTWIYL
jgi:hypothetical protein